MALQPILGVFPPQIKNRIVDEQGRPTAAFHTFLVELWRRSGGAEDQTAATSETVSVQAGQIAQNTVLTQGATQTANDAQTSADNAAGGSARSGSASNPAVNLSGTGWVNGPVVNLTTVSAGDLTIPGTGPQQDNDVTSDATREFLFNGEYRIVEIDGMTEETIHTGTFTATKADVGGGVMAEAYIYPDGSTFGVTYPRTSTGSISYRLDARRVDGPNLISLLLYLYARRS